MRVEASAGRLLRTRQVWQNDENLQPPQRDDVLLENFRPQPMDRPPTSGPGSRSAFPDPAESLPDALI